MTDSNLRGFWIGLRPHVCARDGHAHLYFHSCLLQADGEDGSQWRAGMETWLALGHDENCLSSRGLNQAQQGFLKGDIQGTLENPCVKALPVT